MSRAKFRLEFDGMDRMARQLEQIGVKSKDAAEAALKQSHDYVSKQLHTAMKPHHVTGYTEKSIIETSHAPVEWSGSVASIDIGFDLQNGGFASIFLMYGTEVYGQPHVTPDKELFDAIYGSATRKKVKKIQKEVFEKKIERAAKK